MDPQIWQALGTALGSALGAYGGIKAVLARLTRAEQRLDAHDGRIDRLETQQEQHGDRIFELERKVGA